MSAFLVEPQHIAEIVKWANRDEMGNYAYNSFTKEKIDCEPKNMVRLLRFLKVDHKLCLVHSQQLENLKEN